MLSGKNFAHFFFAAFFFAGSFLGAFFHRALPPADRISRACSGSIVDSPFGTFALPPLRPIAAAASLRSFCFAMPRL